MDGQCCHTAPVLTYNGCVKFYLQVKIVQYIVSETLIRPMAGEPKEAMMNFERQANYRERKKKEEEKMKRKERDRARYLAKIGAKEKKRDRKGREEEKKSDRKKKKSDKNQLTVKVKLTWKKK